MPDRVVVVDGGPLARDDVVAVARRRASVELDPALPGRMAASREIVDWVLSEGRTVYGITTGLGALASTQISTEDAAALQVSLLRSHAAGVGEPVPPPMVRAMLLLRVRTLAQGHSGVRPAVVERMVELLNRDLLPVVPAQGSVGASGDLAPFAHLALPLIGEGELDEGRGPEPAAEVLARHGLEPLELAPKEGLSLLNGTEGMLAYGMLGLEQSELLAKAADIACAMSVEALTGSARPFQARVHQLRPHPGQVVSAFNIARLLEDSDLEASHRDDFAHAVQDAYSLRCAPQVHGAARDVIGFASETFHREAGSVVDNPIVFPGDGDVVSAGNFHGQPLAFALDFLAIAATELSGISERRTDRMLDPDRSSGLPAFLAARPGVQSGLMLAQYTAAALVAENKVLCHPISIESIPTSASQEDHVSMGWGAGRKLHLVIDATARVLGVELICAAQGLEYRAPLEPGPGVAAARDAVREVVAPIEDDRIISGDIESAARLVQDGSLIAAVEEAVGPLR